MTARYFTQVLALAACWCAGAGAQEFRATLTGRVTDPTGAPEAPAEATGQGRLFDDDYSQPDAADGEPVFWTGSAGQPFPDDDFVHAGALEAF